MRQLKVDGKPHDVNVEGDMPLLWWLRDELGKTGPKYGCGIAMCGACTVHVGGRPVRSCSLRIGDVKDDAEITTIAGLDTQAFHAVQAAWIEHQVAQCGYCQPGQIMAAAALLQARVIEGKPPLAEKDFDDTVDRVMSANLCRCGTYTRIRAAIRTAAARLQGQKS